MGGSGGLIVEDKVWVVVVVLLWRTRYGWYWWSYCGAQGMGGSGGLIVEDKVWVVVVVLLWRTRYGW